jgi:hypothetical protein
LPPPIIGNATTSRGDISGRAPELDLAARPCLRRRTNASATRVYDEEMAAHCHESCLDRGLTAARPFVGWMRQAAPLPTDVDVRGLGGITMLPSPAPASPTSSYRLVAKHHAAKAAAIASSTSRLTCTSSSASMFLTNREITDVRHSSLPSTPASSGRCSRR